MLKTTRREKLIEILKKNRGGLTVLEMASRPHCHTDCRKEISDLRKESAGKGWKIADKWEKSKTSNARFKRYFYVKKKAASY